MRKMSDADRESIEMAARMRCIGEYGRSTIVKLLDHIKSIEWDMESLVKASKREAETNDRLTDNVAQLQRELQQVRESRKVAVPKEVAEAIESFREDGWSNRHIIECATRASTGFTKRTAAIKSYAANLDSLLAALVNGYTIEQSPDDYVEQEYRTFLSKGDGSAAAAVEMVLSIFQKDELLQRLRNRRARLVTQKREQGPQKRPE